MSVLEKRKAELMDAIAYTQGQLDRTDFILQGKDNDDFMSYAATVKEIPSFIVYSKKQTIPNFDTYFDLINIIREEVSKRYPDLKCTAPEYCFTTYLDGEYRKKDFNTEYCEAVEQLKPDFNNIRFKKLDAVTAVSVMHKGAYNGLPQAYAFAFKWIEENGKSPFDAPRESYIDGMWNRENSEDWLTELKIPIIKR